MASLNPSARVTSIYNAPSLNTSVTGLHHFSLQDLDGISEINYIPKAKLRLGHVAEKVVSAVIKASSNYNMLFENLQIINHKNTIGELDFILQNTTNNTIHHIELAYKFYVYDPSISSEIIKNWIGPNRNDTLSAKLNKIKHKQFPLLYHQCTKTLLNSINLKEVTQKLCLLVHLFVPYGYNTSHLTHYKHAIVGYYLNLNQFLKHKENHSLYYVPQKTSWGIHPADNLTWYSFSEILKAITTSISEKQSILCWEKHSSGTYLQHLIVWW